MPASASEDLVERLKAAINDADLRRELVEGTDSVSVAAAIAALVGGGSSASNELKLQKKVSLSMFKTTT